MALRRIFEFWWLGPVLAIALLGYSGYRMLSPEKQVFLPGQTSSAHYQIELACDSCHTPFDGVKQEACLDCHGAALEAEEDSHAPSVFNDPRTYNMLAIIDATRCVSCHREHVANLTDGHTVTAPKDFCFACHQDIADERPSHKGFAPEGCAASGCHNYHDNSAVYEDFLAKHLDEPALLPVSQRPQSAELGLALDTTKKLSVEAQDGTDHTTNSQIVNDWAASRHAEAGVNCTACHAPANPPKGVNSNWNDHPVIAVCKSCHDYEASGFLVGKHGMKLAAGLPPMRPSQAHLPMKPKAGDKELSCNSCHGAHRYDLRQAAVSACLNCHDDIHSKAYPSSTHHHAWQTHEATVSCATCHLPRTKINEQGKERLAVMHNQNANLRPNSKMLRTVCLECHGLGFSLNSLADVNLLLNNYATPPATQVDSIEMVKRRLAQKQRKTN